jgi:hypothetical protein
MGGIEFSVVRSSYDLLKPQVSPKAREFKAICQPECQFLRATLVGSSEDLPGYPGQAEFSNDRLQSMQADPGRHKRATILTAYQERFQTHFATLSQAQKGTSQGGRDRDSPNLIGLQAGNVRTIPMPLHDEDAGRDTDAISVFSASAQIDVFLLQSADF